MPDQPATGLYDKDVFTTGEAAAICGLSQQTIIRCFDADRIKGFRVPGSRFRRIPRDALISFMQDNGIPMPTATNAVLLIATPDRARLLTPLIQAAPARPTITLATSALRAGHALADAPPALIVLDHPSPAEPRALADLLAEHEPLRAARLLIVGPAPAPVRDTITRQHDDAPASIAAACAAILPPRPGG